MKVDDVCEAAKRLAESWLNGNRNDVAAEIAVMHPLVAGWVCIMIATRLGRLHAAGDFALALSKRVEGIE